MATYTEKDLQEMIWRANTNEKVLIAHEWISKNVQNSTVRDRLLQLCEYRPYQGNDRHMFSLMITVFRKASERGDRT